MRKSADLKLQRGDRRRFLRQSVALGVGGLLPAAYIKQAMAVSVSGFGAGELIVVSDGNMQLPREFVFPQSIDAIELDTLLQQHNMDTKVLTPDCNVTLWQNEDRLILFDVGAGPNFMPSTGKLLENLAAADIDPGDVTDVVFTHAHPDHLWGLLDDFDELICPDADYHMAEAEWNYWRAPGTLDKTPDNRKSFVAGAQNRFTVLEDIIKLFKPGQEVLSGVEAVDTSGHTPGHTAFALHSGNDSVLLIGDAITNVAVSFAKPDWPIHSDQDPDKGRKTRVKLLDRLAQEQSAIVGYHLPYPGKGRVARIGDHYQFVSD